MIREYSFCSSEFMVVFFVSQGMATQKTVFSLLTRFRFLHRFIRPTLLSQPPLSLLLFTWFVLGKRDVVKSPITGGFLCFSCVSNCSVQKYKQLICLHCERLIVSFLISCDAVWFKFHLLRYQDCNSNFRFYFAFVLIFLSILLFLTFWDLLF